MILGFFEIENFQMYKYKIAKNPPGGWFSFFREIFLFKKKVPKGLLLGRFLIFLFFLGEENFKILSKKAKKGQKPGVFLGGGGVMP